MASRWLETSSASTALGSPSSWPDPDSDSDDSGKRSWSGSETSSLSRWVLTLNDSVRANDPDLQPTEALIDVEDPGARDPDVRGAAIDRVNRFAVPESIGTHYPNLPFGHSVFNKDLVPKDVIDRGTATSAYLNHMKRGSVSRAYSIRAGKDAKKALIAVIAISSIQRSSSVTESAKACGTRSSVDSHRSAFRMLM